MKNNAAATSLENEIVSLFSQHFALTHALLVKLRAFDESEEWHTQGFLSCAHWLSFRVGLDLGAAREKVRTARALAALPQIDAALEVGEISYSKVRALSRVATAETETELLQVAKYATASQVEKLTRAWVKVDRANADKREEKRSCQVFFDSDGMCVVSAKLRPEEGAVLMKALEVAREKGQSLADALVAVAERSLRASEQESRERHHVIVHTDASFAGGAVEGRLGDKVGISAEGLRQLSCDAVTTEVLHDKDGAIIDVGRKTRRISAKLRLALNERDGGCRYPGCTNKMVDIHHVKSWCDGGETNLANLVSACRYHHGFIHDGKALLGADQIFRHPDGHPIDNPLPRTTFVAPLMMNRCVPAPSGEPLDYGYALSVLRP
jgi:hypothetical protein